MNDDQRDYSEEAYNRRFCDACGTSPCEWDGTTDGFHVHTEAEARSLLAKLTECDPHDWYHDGLLARVDGPICRTCGVRAG